jgi:poly-gamma-glutamate capsule biosynthesis protein CapA/YwtB (metallophosphatase superfamily)
MHRLGLPILVAAAIMAVSPAVAGNGQQPAQPGALPPTVHRLVVPGLAHEVTRSLTLAAVGDVMLARTVDASIAAEGPGLPFAGALSALKTADIVTANLECTAAQSGTPAAKGFTFRASPAALDALTAGGVNVVSLANNHSLDFGPSALLETEAGLDGRQIAHAGAGANAAEARAPAIVERGGLRIAFLSYVDVPVEWRGFDARSWTATASSPGVAWLDPAEVAADIARARTVADVVVVFMHFGIEDQREPSETQRAEARAAIDAGASIVIGHHPHVVQPVERWGNGLIAYSMGNFVFDGEDNPTNESAILLVDLTETGVSSYRLVPVTLDSAGFPQIDP